MHRKIATALLVTLFLGSFSGCGTFSNQFLADKNGTRLSSTRPYGGVEFDWIMAKAYWNETQQRVLGIGWVLFLTLDIPASAVADTILLPRWMVAKEIDERKTDTDEVLQMLEESSTNSVPTRFQDMPSGDNEPTIDELNPAGD